MTRSIIKEIIIILLLLLAIILALGVLFYDYIPTNRTIPTVGAYSTSESIKTELNEKLANDDTVLVTYEITGTDLNTYVKTKDYKPVKANPFSTYDTTPTGGGTGNNTDGNDEDGTTNTIKAGTNNSKGSTFYNNTGTK